MPENPQKSRPRSTAKNVGGSVIDLDDGRSLGPGETAEDVNLEHPHNDRLVLAGLLAACQLETPKEK